ncbi:3-hydroxyacyl-CoA dehydrogenase NAD-binding domain-containing protein [Mesorhizobium sp. M0833]|uniref:3-hydroxyacyl-CoA dehydrogenase NAD-binding domain-containing protein n=1 Tax=Mesorhizobium sp. M0833 TaxID=2957009 RepID=UPI00333BECCC
MSNESVQSETHSKTARLVEISNQNCIAIVMIDNPPVNALSAQLRAELFEALTTLADDEDVLGIVIACSGRTFVAGGDIGEFGTPKQLEPPLLPDLCTLVEAIRKPIVAAIHGTALGGGLELALAASFRIVHTDAKLGLPEVKLGFIPGSGGTVRLPRLVGPEKALEMILSGSPISAEDALASGLAELVSETNLLADSVTFLRTFLDTKAGDLVPLRERDDRFAATRADPSRFEALAKGLIAKVRGLSAPIACVEAVRNAFVLSFDEALREERKIFLQLVSGPESRSLRHLFFAERQSNRTRKDIRARTVKRIGVIGAGTMGGGIAMSFANAGFSVTILEMSDEALSRGLGIIERNYAISVSRGSLSAEARAERLARLSPTTDYGALAECDLIIEAAFEAMDVKRQIFSQLGASTKPGTILATNTSYLDVNEIAEASGRPQDVVGLHFFSPANIMKLLEVVRGNKTSPDVIATALDVARRIGKVPVVVGVCHGFVGNRMLTARAMENEALLLEGASPGQVDKAFTDFGWPMGPFQMGDLAGLDIGWRNRKAQGKTALIADALCEAGRFGQKTGRGWYLYKDGSRDPQPDPEVDALVEGAARRQGITRRAIPSDEIVERTLFPMINEGARILAEGIAGRASDIDLVWVYGYGFPAGKGGPMFWAAQQKVIDIPTRLDHWFKNTGREIFRPTRELETLLR